MLPLSILAPLLVASTVIWTLSTFVYRYRAQRRSSPIREDLKKAMRDVYGDIDPLTTHDWRAEEALKIRPSRPKYHLTMGLENIKLSECVLIDKTYLTRIHVRRDMHQQHGRRVTNCNPSCILAVNELYEWMTTVYLPRRFPTMFKLSFSYDKPTQLRNLTTGEDLPTSPDGDPFTTLKTLSSHVDTDFIFLLPTPSTAAPPTYPGPAFHPSSYGAVGTSGTSALADIGPKYHLHAYAGCFPSGFDWLEKFGKPLAAIHAPVPHYDDKLEKSMDRFFATLPAGKIVARKNWAVTMDRQLFKVKGNHGDARRGASADAGKGEGEKVDLSQTVLRCERQTLHRLPRSGALVFGFKTFQDELSDVKREGGGHALADAIEGLDKGSVPRMQLYKKADVWGKIVCEYLRS